MSAKTASDSLSTATKIISAPTPNKTHTLSITAKGKFLKESNLQNHLSNSIHKAVKRAFKLLRKKLNLRCKKRKNSVLKRHILNNK
jgi:hypothetical protein